MQKKETLGEYAARCALAFWMTKHRLVSFRAAGESGADFYEDAHLYGWVGYTDFTWEELVIEYSEFNEGAPDSDPLMLLPPEVKVMRSAIDGRWMIDIDTSDCPENNDGPILSVWLNDGIIWDNKAT